MKLTKIFLTLFLFLSFALTTQAQQSIPTKEQLEGTTWILVEAQDLAGDFVLEHRELNRELQLEFQASSQAQCIDVAGFSGVNQFHGSALCVRGKRGLTLHVDPLASTKMAGPEVLMNLEQRFHQALQNTEYMHLDEQGALLLSSEASPELLLRFLPQE